ncbi:hypothetical protein FNF27_04550 [Cafeteria roenbergensis]|nr:hypothetical protein FNF29_06176 [Cafeteria roenbergensis]KAA0149296.1 hypothetical protein FNF31_07256 [Cafeteria roenbergensis]KAA0173989.1 hypothetical protein FNF27_04550 [Cafeteria roenbergensis]|eukprot:KAA0149088.1 hypothetical protein FNF29_06176 [Cafeteria roenbergensis]
MAESGQREQTLFELESLCTAALQSVREIHVCASERKPPEEVNAATKRLEASLSAAIKASSKADSILVPEKLLQRIDDDAPDAVGPVEWLEGLTDAGERASQFSVSLSRALDEEAAALEALAKAVRAAPE